MVGIRSQWRDERSKSSERLKEFKREVKSSEIRARSRVVNGSIVRVKG